MFCRSLCSTLGGGLVAALLAIGPVVAQEAAPPSADTVDQAPDKQAPDKQAADKIDFSKLKKGDKVEFKRGDKWLPGEFDRFVPPNLVAVDVGLKGLDRPVPFPADQVRLPAGKDAPELKPRTFTDVTGKHKIKAVLLRVKDKTAILRRTDDGKELAVPLAKLSVADRKYIERMQAAFQPQTPEKDAAEQPADSAETADPPAEAAAP